MKTHKPISPDEQMALNEEPFEPKKFQTTMSGMNKAFREQQEAKQAQEEDETRPFQTTMSGMNETFKKQAKHTYPRVKVWHIHTR